MYRIAVERMDAVVDFAWRSPSVVSEVNDAVAVPLPLYPSLSTPPPLLLPLYSPLSSPHLSSMPRCPPRPPTTTATTTAHSLSCHHRPLALQVQWAGYVRAPSSAPLTFTVTTDGAARLFVNRVAVLNASAARSSSSQALDLVAKAVVMDVGGLNEIVLEYERSAGDAIIQLQVDDPFN